ncbi:MAG TPA: efflux RND transporter periplasmic adaptor subunit [Lacunisphaera sp.]|nr:efflux RND transporter periplasmic adaptor subunit [Lacunisphaera sp.]
MKTRLFHAATALAVAFIAGGCQRDRGPIAQEARSVEAHTITTHDLPAQVVASGAIEAIDKAEVAFMVPGRVIAVDAEDGAMVRQGQLLARLDPADYEKNLAIAEAQLAEVQARHGRLSRLHEAGSLTDTDFDRVDAALKQATSAAGLARRQLGYTELRAPFAGWIVKRGIAPGFVAAPGAPVFTLYSPGPVWAHLGVSEADIGQVRIGQSAAVQVPATRTAPRHGTVEAILPQADPLSRAFTVKVRLENQDGGLRHGNVVVGQILTGNTRHAITVPPQAVQKNPDGSLFVWQIDPTREVARRQLVEIGALRATEVEITAGLKEGDRIVLNVPHTLFEGARLNVVGAR